MKTEIEKKSVKFFSEGKKNSFLEHRLKNI